MPTKPITPLVLDSVGVFGLNTQANASSLDHRWLTQADNVMVNSEGRLTSRKGLKQYSASIGNYAVKSIAEVTKTDGTTELFGAANGEMYKLGTTTVPVTMTAESWNPTQPTITDSNWQFFQYDDDLLGVQEGHDAVHYDSTSGTWARMVDTSTWGSPSGITTFDPSCASSAYGRSWVGGLTEEPNTLFYSQVANHHNFSAGGSGSLNLNAVWGYDTIVGIEIFNNKLIVFGKFNIAIYNGPWDIDVTDGTETFGLDEIIKGVGCVSRDSIKAFGDDILFLSADGVRSLNRTKIQDKMPLTDLTKNVKNDIIKHIAIEEKKNIKATYNHAGGYYILSFTEINEHYILDFKTLNPDGTPRVSKWVFSNEHSPKAYLSIYDGTLYVGVGGTDYAGSVHKYDGYYDSDYDTTASDFVNTSYQSVWKSTHMDFGDPSVAKLLKKFVCVVDGGRESDINIKWYRDYGITYDSHTFTLSPVATGNIALFGAATSLFGCNSSYDYGGVGWCSNSTGGVLSVENETACLAASETWTEVTNTSGVDQPTNCSLSAAKFAPLFYPKEYKVNLSKSAKVLQIEMITTVNGFKGALQSMTVLAKGGKIR